MGRRKRNDVFRVGEWELGQYRGKWCAVRWEGDRTDSSNRRRTSLRIDVSRGIEAGQQALIKFAGNVEASTPKNGGTIREIYEAYTKDREIEGKDTSRYMQHWKSLQATFGDLKPEDLMQKILVDGEMRTLCHKYAFERSATGVSNDTVWTELERLRASLNWAAKTKLIPEAPYIWLPRRAEPRDRVLTAQECTRLISCCTAPHTRLFIILALSTGARTSAILELTWDRVDFANHTIDFRKTEKLGILEKKTRKGRAITDMSKIADLALREAKAAALTKFVIEFNGQPLKSVKTSFRTARDNAGLERGVSPHTLRHTAASVAFDALMFSNEPSEVILTKVSKLLGHKNTQTTANIYIKYASRLTNDPARAISDFLMPKSAPSTSLIEAHN